MTAARQTKCLLRNLYNRLICLENPEEDLHFSTSDRLESEELRSSEITKTTQLISGRTGIQTQAVCLQSLCFQPFCKMSIKQRVRTLTSLNLVPVICPPCKLMSQHFWSYLQISEAANHRPMPKRWAALGILNKPGFGACSLAVRQMRQIVNKLHTGCEDFLGAESLTQVDRHPSVSCGVFVHGGFQAPSGQGPLPAMQQTQVRAPKAEKIPQRGKWQPTPVYFNENCMDREPGQPTYHGSQELNTSEHTRTHTFAHTAAGRTGARQKRCHDLAFLFSPYLRILMQMNEPGTGLATAAFPLIPFSNQLVQSDTARVKDQATGIHILVKLCLS